MQNNPMSRHENNEGLRGTGKKLSVSENWTQDEREVVAAAIIIRLNIESRSWTSFDLARARVQELTELAGFALLKPSGFLEINRRNFREFVDPVPVQSPVVPQMPQDGSQGVQ